MSTIAALGQIGSPSAIKPILLFLEDSNINIRKRMKATLALEKIGWQPSQDEIGALYWIAKEEWDQCVEIGSPAVESLIRVFNDGKGVLGAAEALGKIGDDRAIEPLIRALRNRYARRRQIAALALVNIYRSSGVSEDDKKYILAQRSDIIYPLENRHEDHGPKDCVHFHTDQHHDYGIGIDFPL